MPRHTKTYLNETRLEKSEERYTIKGMLQDEFYNFVHIERRKFFYTALDLTLRPAKAIKMVLSGHKRYLYSYFNYLVLIGTITIFLSVRYKFFVSGYDLGDVPNFLSGFLDSIGFGKEYRKEFFSYADEYATVVNIIAIPFFMMASYITFYNKKYNLAEHLILNTYITAQQLLFVWITIPFIELMPASKTDIIAVYTALTVIYNLWVYLTFFPGKWWLNLIKSCIALFCAYTIYTPINYGLYYIFRPVIKYLDAVF